MSSKKIEMTGGTTGQEAITSIAGSFPVNPETALLTEGANGEPAATLEHGVDIGKLVVGAAEKTAGALRHTVTALGRLAVRTTEAVADATVRTTIAGTKATFFAGCWGVGMSAGLILGGSWAFDKLADIRNVRDDNLTAFNMSQWKSQMDAKEKTLLACEEDTTAYREKYLTLQLKTMLQDKGLNVEYLWQPDFKNNSYTVKVSGGQEGVHCYGNLHMEGNDLSQESVADLDCPHETPKQYVRVAAETTKGGVAKKTAVTKPSPTPTPAP